VETQQRNYMVSLFFRIVSLIIVVQLAQ